MDMHSSEHLAVLMAAGIAMADKREKLAVQLPTCPRCRAVQVQLLSVETQSWKCRKCRFSFNTAIKV